MKSFIYLLFVLVSVAAMADDNIEILGGGLTYHMTGDAAAATEFVNPITPDNRLIFNTLVGVTLEQGDKDRFQSETIFAGQNSVGALMSGGIYENGYVFGNLQLGVALGAYLQDDSSFTTLGVNPFRLTDINSTDVVPVFGAAVNYKIHFTDETYLKLNIVVSPIITNLTLAIGTSI